MKRFAFWATLMLGSAAVTWLLLLAVLLAPGRPGAVTPAQQIALEAWLLPGRQPRTEVYVVEHGDGK